MNFWRHFRNFLTGSRKRKFYNLKDEERITEFQRRTGVWFQNPDLLRLALTHRSFLGSTDFDPRDSNERLEFLGDAVLELTVIDDLFKRFPDDLEGELTRKKSLLVSRNVLAERAEMMGLGQYILMSSAERDSGGGERASILADTFEAVLGAIFLDQGLDASQHFVNSRILANAEGLLRDRDHRNYKSELQEIIQSRYKVPPRYRVVGEVGPEHRKQFTIQVELKGQVLGSGAGSNKKEAEQNAARDALEKGLS
ncbi:MAG: ribonuclease III [Candidatus Eisenbacteria bacterium]|uniref:Ribonuclease 3 n=1 Tax=Eiseniibacteriota bacterium TaxID=2212470 RepID=A0A948W6F5_UNCEI|nr:ribonuclease III [Candidatus Eisenbacteria bacterium]MBU1948918.1 ribonuclease III [Candidatus Eisenbacteria bacterium]MBU2690596.1 ribonuclease III [Candidatus Eisenbacteria bacterium]